MKPGGPKIAILSQAHVLDFGELPFSGLSGLLAARPAANPRLGLCQLPLLTPQVNPGSLYRGGKST